ncbi:MAG: acyl-CoA dehydrogenase family protein [Candidatus Thorarchaeota archaeon]
MEFSLTDQQKELKKRAREFAIREVLPVAKKYDESEEFPLPVIKKAWEEGLLNLGIPKQYGGHGYGLLDSCLVVEEISSACPGIATSVFDNNLGAEPIIIGGNDEQKERILRELVNDFKLIAFATSEPTMGSDVASMKCRAEKDGEEYILNGAKFWITNGGFADYITVFATIDPEKKHKGIAAFIVDTKTEGVRLGKHIPKLGQRSSNTVAVSLRNVRIPKENILAKPGRGFVLAMQTFAHTRPAIGAFAVGCARSAMEYAIDYANKREAFGRPIGNYQVIQHKIAEMYKNIEAARLLTHKAAWEADQGMDNNISSSIAKAFASDVAMEVTTEAIQIYGGYGYLRTYPVEKLFRDAKLYQIYEGTSEIQRIILARHAMKRYEHGMPSVFKRDRS